MQKVPLTKLQDSEIVWMAQVEQHGCKRNAPLFDDTSLIIDLREALDICYSYSNDWTKPWSRGPARRPETHNRYSLRAITQTAPAFENSFLKLVSTTEGILVIKKPWKKNLPFVHQWNYSWNYLSLENITRTSRKWQTAAFKNASEKNISLPIKISLESLQLEGDVYDVQLSNTIVLTARMFTAPTFLTFPGILSVKEDGCFST